MKIDPRIEPLMRETLDAAVKGDAKRFESALDAMQDPTTMAEAVKLATAVALSVLVQRFGRMPDERELEQISHDVQTHQGWSGLRHDEVLATLNAMTGRAGVSVEPQAMAVAVYVIAAYLLAASTKKPKWWFEYLDEIEAVIEAAP